MTVTYRTVDEFAQGQRLDNYLVKHLKGVPKSHIYRVIRKGEVRVNKGRKKAEYKLQVDDVVRIPPIRVSNSNAISTSDNLKQLLKNSIVFEDDGMLILNKPSGLAVHSGSGINTGVIEALRDMYKEPVELVHRLDRSTSGLLIIAKKRAVLKSLNEQLSEHQIEKRYTTLVKGVWSKKRHTIDAPLYNNSRYTVVDSRGKNAVSHFQPIKNFHEGEFGASLVEVTIETGRTHQIRVHAKYADHPLAGDDKYGDKYFEEQVKSKGLERLFLHAHQVIFTNPTTKKIQKVHSPLADDLLSFLDKL
jgi:23S rRNA pseudouridine955/2504/2580 synthase